MNEKKKDVVLDDKDFQKMLGGILEVDPSEIPNKKPPSPRRGRKKSKHYDKYRDGDDEKPSPS